MANSAGLQYQTIAEGIFTALMGMEPEKTLPALGIRERMEKLTGTYQVYKGLAIVKVINKAGLLHLEQKNHFTDIVVPLIPEDDTYGSLRFYILTDGVRQPVEFVVDPSVGIDLYIERYRYHKTS